MTTWVRHISGQGEKWEVRDCEYNKGIRADYLVNSKDMSSHSDTRYHWLPKSEYIPCEPPEQWDEMPVTLFALSAIEHWVQMQDRTRTIGKVWFFSEGYRVKSLVVEKRRS